MKKKNITILVTGATGFLGRNILMAFAKQPQVDVIAACRDQRKLTGVFEGQVRTGDLRDPAYRQSVVQGIDVICHTGTWAAMWNHKEEEQQNFYAPSIDLIEQAIAAGVSRFLMTSTVAITGQSQPGKKTDDFAKAAYTGFWPHLDYLIDIDRYMQANAHRGTQMITMRLGHFVGAGNTIGLVPALVPRLKSFLVPWLAGGNGRLPLVTDSDLGRSFIAASFAESLSDYESFNICGMAFPTTREVIDYIAGKTGVPRPYYSVPFAIGHLFAWLMEILFPILPGKAPFLTRSIVYLAENRVCETDYAANKLGYRPQKSWQTGLDEALTELAKHNYPWPHLTQKFTNQG